jgi:UDP-glucose-4-epimerase GalE
VLSSTCAVYGVPARVPIGEEDPKNPVNPYGASKLMVERILADYEQAYGVRHAALRYFNAAGADLDGEVGEARAVETHLVPLILDGLLGIRPPVSILGEDYPTPDGTAIRDYVHVADLAEAHVAALRRLLDGGPSLQLNLGTGRGHSVREVIACAERVIGCQVPASAGPRRAGDPPELVADPCRARAVLRLDFTLSSSLESIIASAWAWHRKRRDGASSLG